MPYRFSLINGTQLPENEWDTFVRSSPQASVYALHGYAAAVCPTWQAVLAADEASGKWLAVLPFAYAENIFFKTIYTPYFVQTWGVLFSPEISHASTRRNLVAGLVAALPAAHRVAIQCAPTLPDGLPLHWAGLSLQTRYSFILPLAEGEAQLWSKISESVQRRIKKARQNGLVFSTKVSSDTLATLITLQQKAGHDIFLGGNHTKALQKLTAYLKQHQLGEILAIYQGETCLAAALFADFNGKRHYLTGAFHPEYPKSGAMSLLMWEAIRTANGCHTFDFEGSMVASIAEFFRTFGATPVPYLAATRTARWLRWRM